MDVPAYLKRIHYSGPLTPSRDTLRSLHAAHTLAVPFENLDIDRGVPIVLGEAPLFDKIVKRRRGGFCYELNGLFAALLRELGFPVTLLSARVRDGEGYGPEFDHLVLLVELEERYLADVGFGEWARYPLRLDEPSDQNLDKRAYRLSSNGRQWEARELAPDGTPTHGYRFSLQHRQLEDFAEMSRYHQTSPESIFTQKRTITLPTPDGRVTLSGPAGAPAAAMRLIGTSNGEKTERAVQSESEYAELLREHFAVIL